MFGRVGGCITLVLWMASMTWLVVHDLLPVWTALEPPKVVHEAWLLDPDHRKSQSGFFDDSGRVGTLWTAHEQIEGAIVRTDLLTLHGLKPPLPPLRIDSTVSFVDNGVLDAFEVDLRVPGHYTPVSLKGERYPTDFVFTLDAPLIPVQTFKIPIQDAGMIAEAFNRFSSLPDIEVGMTWRMQVLNPIASILRVGDYTMPIVVTVVGRETIATNFGLKECFVVEAADVRAWVDDDGLVQLQEAQLPTGQRIRILREAFDQSSYEEARRSRLFGS